MTDQIASAIRSVLKIVGTYLVTKGIADSETVETAIGGAVAVVGIVWSYFNHRPTDVKTP